MSPESTRLPLSRRDLLKLSGAAAGVALASGLSAVPRPGPDAQAGWRP